LFFEGLFCFLIVFIFILLRGGFVFLFFCFFWRVVFVVELPPQPHKKKALQPQELHTIKEKQYRVV